MAKDEVIEYLDEDSRERAKVIDKEIRLVFDKFQIGNFDKTEKELWGLRYSAGDLEEVERSVMDKILSNTDIEEDEEALASTVESVVYTYYLMLNFTDMYLTSGDFSGLAGKPFKDIWGKISLEDKVSVVELAVIVEDTLSIVHGMYLLLSQLERIETKGG